jgi:lycopene beta-cyclase
LQRFYGLDAKLVARFYASHSTVFDKVRILTGKPPVPFFRAVSVVMRG